MFFISSKQSDRPNYTKAIESMTLIILDKVFLEFFLSDIMLMLKSVWLWIQAVLWPSMSYETQNGLTQASNESVHFQVLGVGLSRTGTFSTRIALTKMLGGKCYHGYVSSLDGEPEFWQKAADGLLTEQDWIQGLEGRGYTAGVGEPINYFYPEILKVIVHKCLLMPDF